MDRDRNIQSLGLVNLLILALVGAASEMAALYGNSATGQTGMAFVLMGLLVAAVSYFQMRLENRERLEQLEFDELKKSPAGAALFTQEAETFPARRSREQFEKYFIPGFAIVLFLLQGAAVFGLWKWLAAAPMADHRNATVTMALSALFSLVFFMRGKYVAGIARWEEQRLLRPAASYILVGSVVTLLMTLTQAVAFFGYSHIDIVVAKILVGLLAVVALENLITLVFEVYRPRLKGQAAHLLYESRLIGLFGQPGGLITTAAQALDYQFGFKVSETWMYRFMEKALAWIVLLQMGLLFLSTSLVVVEAPEEAVLERWGHPVEGREVLGPGLHFKWPWPIDKVYRFRSHEVQTVLVGYEIDPVMDAQPVMVWARAHHKEDNMLVASRERTVLSDSLSHETEQVVPVNLLAVNIPVQFRIKNLHDWVYGHSDASNLLAQVANREGTRFLVNIDVEQFMAGGRLAAASELRELIQKRADENRLGVEVVYVGLMGVHPPVKVAPDYEAVVGALQDKQSNTLAAQAYWAQKLPRAHAEASNTVYRAQGESVAKINTAAAEAAQYTNQIIAYNASPSVYMQRSYLETLVKGVGPVRKYVVGATNTQDVVLLNLEDKVRADLLDVPLPPSK